jgi:ABC-type uncharacterized transport system permease subunit
MKEPGYETTKERVYVAAGLLLPVTMVVVSIMGAINVSQWDNDQPRSAGEFLMDVAAHLLLAVPYVIVLLLTAIPWIGLHRQGWRHWSAAAGLGFIATFIPAFIWIDHGAGSSVSRMGGFALGASIFGLGGALIALTSWRLAYRRS